MCYSNYDGNYKYACAYVHLRLYHLQIHKCTEQKFIADKTKTKTDFKCKKKTEATQKHQWKNKQKFN